MRSLSSLLLIAVLGYLALISYLYLAQASFVYLPSRVLTGDPGDIGLNFENVRLETRDGVELHGWFVPAADARYTLLFLHGNAGNISHRLQSLRMFHELGLSVFIFDYRGYGRSGGETTERGTYLDAAAAWRYLIERRGLRPQQLLVFGRSVGGGVAAWLASVHQPAALILESTFTSVPDLGAEMYPWLPVRLLARINYPSLSRMAEISSPTLVIHSRDDSTVPFRHGQRLYDALRGPKSLLAINGSHNEGFVSSRASYMAGIRQFIATLDTSARPSP